MKRGIIKLLLFFALGAVMNVAVAWGCAYWQNVVDDDDGGLFVGVLHHEEQTWLVAEMRGVGSLAVAGVGVAEWDEDDFDEWRNVPRVEASLDSIPGWSRLPESASVMEPAYLHPVVLDIARGWPCVALHCGFDGAIEGDLTHAYPEIHGGVEVGRFPRSSALGKRVLPNLPVWPGFAINTVFYAVILWLLLLVGPRTLRSLVRRRRGRCLKCGYDLRGDFDAGCPECGWSRAETRT